jgi:hypothetical protein
MIHLRHTKVLGVESCYCYVREQLFYDEGYI